MSKYIRSKNNPDTNMHQDIPTYPQVPHRTAESMIQVIASKLDNLHSDVNDLKDVMREMSSAVSKLAIIDERQSQASQTVERMFVAIEKMEVRLTALERSQPIQQQVANWVTAGLWAVVCVTALFIAKKVGLLP